MCASNSSLLLLPFSSGVPCGGCSCAISMSSAALLQLQPGDLASGRPYAERDERDAPWHDKAALAVWHGVLWPALRPLRGESRQRRSFVAQVEAHAAAAAKLDNAGIRQRTTALRHQLRAQGFA